MKDSLPNRAGWWKDTPAGRIYLFTATGLAEATAGHDFETVLEALELAGALVETDPGRKSRAHACSRWAHAAPLLR
jgi:putative DNA primase/helicase